MTIISIETGLKPYRFLRESLNAQTCSVARMPSGLIVTNDEYGVDASTLFLKLLFPPVFTVMAAAASVDRT